MLTYSVGDLTRRDILILKISAALAGSGVFLSTGSAAAAQPGGQLTWGVSVSLAPTWFDPAETPGGNHHPLLGDVRPARCHAEAHAGPTAGAEPRGVVDRVRGRPHIRIRPAQGREVPQR